MKISGFTFIRNGISLKYPFVESIQSILPICDEIVVAVGKSEDKTREYVRGIHPEKIKIIDTVWDDNLRIGGGILAQQTDLAFEAITGDWGFYLQGDEVVHEKDLETIVDSAEKNLKNEKVDGLLFNYFHFYGNYNYIAKSRTRGTYPFEVRLIKNNKMIRSFKDAQGFRKYDPGSQSNNMKPERLKVKKAKAHIFHYGKVRGPKDELERARIFHRLWHDDQWIDKTLGKTEEFNYSPDYPLELFTGTHPEVMRRRIAERNWDFRYDPLKVTMPIGRRIMNMVEHSTGLRPFSFRNYTLLR
ncbi:MAG: glycosyltransferase [Chitinophagales bacterium]|nr:glycosyltransferase [Chitinophagales bacterium]